MEGQPILDSLPLKTEGGIEVPPAAVVPADPSLNQHHHHPPTATVAAPDASLNQPHHPPADAFPGLFEAVPVAVAAAANPVNLAPKPSLDTKKISENKHNVWMDFLSKLRAYKLQYGDCQVPRGYHLDTRLANWVCEQRKQYKLLQDGKKSNITQGRIQLLEDLGFAWNAQEAAWDRHYKDMTQFKADNGHCLVPENHTQYPKLYVWIKEQRRHYSLWKQGKPAHMTEKRHQLLEQIGFCWDHREAIWSTRLQQLKTYKEQNNNCLVPAEYSLNPKLGRWVKQQRKEYKKFVSGKASQINQQRIDALDEIEFCWRASKSNRVDKKGENGESDSEDDRLGIKKEAPINAATTPNALLLNHQTLNPEMDQPSMNVQPINGVPVLPHDPQLPDQARIWHEQADTAVLVAAQQQHVEGLTMQPQQGMVIQPLQSTDQQQIKVDADATMMGANAKPSDVGIDQASPSVDSQMAINAQDTLQLQQQQQQQQPEGEDPLVQTQAPTAEAEQMGLAGAVAAKPLDVEQQEKNVLEIEAPATEAPAEIEPQQVAPTPEERSEQPHLQPQQAAVQAPSGATAFFVEEASQGPAKRQKLEQITHFEV